jgi:hypothetical protein
LSERELEEIIELVKILKSKDNINFPEKGGVLEIPATDAETKHLEFKFNVHRKSKRDTYGTYQFFKGNTALVRIDLDGQTHTNPDGHKLNEPHIHIYSEGYALKWAYPLGDHIPTNTYDLAQVLADFLEYTHVINRPPIVTYGGGLFGTHDRGT